LLPLPYWSNRDIFIVCERKLGKHDKPSSYRGGRSRDILRPRDNGAMATPQGAYQD
jgi:hypothetical protein